MVVLGLTADARPAVQWFVILMMDVTEASQQQERSVMESLSLRVLPI